KLVMRIFDPEVLVRDFAELGFSEDDARRWQEMTNRPNGIVLVTGPTGSGKTTTLYSTLKQLATPDVNVCTIEDPIEMVEPSFNQTQMQHNIGLDFASGVRALLRQDPDIIMVGEIRDLETAEMAIQAAPPEKVYFPKGCLECRNTGYLGRIGIYEILTLTPGLRELVRPSAELDPLRDQARRDGMRAMRLSGAEKVNAGLTTIDEVLKM